MHEEAGRKQKALDYNLKRGKDQRNPTQASALEPPLEGDLANGLILATPFLCVYSLTGSPPYRSLL